MSDSMISLREKISASFFWNWLALLQLDARHRRVLLELAHLGEPGELLLLHLAAGRSRRSSSASTSRFSRTLGSKRTTTSPCLTSEPSGASQPMRKGPGTPAGTEIGVACTACRFPCAGTRRTKSGASIRSVGTSPPAPRRGSGRNAAEGDQRGDRHGGEAQPAGRPTFDPSLDRLLHLHRLRPPDRGATPGRPA